MDEEIIQAALDIAQGKEPMPFDADGQLLDQLSLYLTYWVAETVIEVSSPEDSEETSEENYRTAMSQAIVAAYLIGFEHGFNHPRESNNSAINAEIIETLLREGSVTISLNIE